jgi:hypothetical protein
MLDAPSDPLAWRARDLSMVEGFAGDGLLLAALRLTWMSWSDLLAHSAAT